LPEDEAVARRLIDDLVKAIAAEHDVAIHVHGGFGRPPKPIDEKAARLFALVEESAALLGRPITHKASGGVCDGNNIAACGVPVVDTMGARGGAIHSPDEYLIVESLPERAQLSTLVMLRLAERGSL
jgi:glutamate carboxypeptidase